MASQALDLDALRAAAEPWTFTAGGRQYVARPVSIEQVIAYEGAIVGASGTVVLRERWRLLRLAFPWRVSFLWRGDPVAMICRAAPVVHRALIDSFFRSLRSSPSRSGTSATPLSSGS